MTDEPNYDSKTMQAKMSDDPIASPTKDQISGNTVMQKIRSLIDNYLGWSKQITDKVNSLEPGGGGKAYTAGDGIAISDDDVISNTDHIQTQTNTSDIAAIRVSMSDLASSAALGAETEARKTADNTLQTNIDKKQDKLSSAQQSALDSGITSTKVQKYDAYANVKQNTLSQAQLDACNSGITAAKVNSYNTDISQLKISDAEHTSTLADQATQLSAQATEITGIKAKDATQDTSISALQTKTTTHDTEIQGLSESVVSDLTGTFTDSTRTLKLSLERESAPSIDCSVVIPGGAGGGAVDSVNGKTGTVVLSASDVLTTAQQNAANSGITTAKVSTYDGYATHIDSLEIDMTGVANSISDLNSDLNGKADFYTVTQIQTAVGGCFNDASVSGNNLILSTVGGQQNTLTLPGGGGGASLPENGYYWEKITEENWPTDWAATDVVMINVDISIEASASSWAEIPSGITIGISNRFLPNIISLSNSSAVGVINLQANYIAMGTITAQYSVWSSATSRTPLIQVYSKAINGGGSITKSASLGARNAMVTKGLYRLRKFS